jgi:hypothetical protein
MESHWGDQTQSNEVELLDNHCVFMNLLCIVFFLLGYTSNGLHDGKEGCMMLPSGVSGGGSYCLFVFRLFMCFSITHCAYLWFQSPV